MLTDEASRDVIRRYFAAIDANDIDAVLDVFHDEVRYERPGYEPIDGKERLRRFFTVERVIASGRHDIEGILVDNDQVSAWGMFTGLSRTGAELSEGWCDVYRFQSDRIWRRRTYFFRPAV
jgi:ketosteroid isomerase-like protein